MSATYAERPAAAPRERRPEEPLNPGESPLARLTPEQIEQLGREFDAIHDEVFADLGERDARYIRDVIRLQRQIVLIAAPCSLLGSRRRPLWLAGTTLAVARQDRREHGDRPQRHARPVGLDERPRDPLLHVGVGHRVARRRVAPFTQLRAPHVHQHRGKDRDLGYEIMRIDPHQRWHPVYLLQPFYNLLLMAFFEWGVAFHDLDHSAIQNGEKSKEQLLRELKAIGLKARRQALKDYIAFPLALGPLVPLDARRELHREHRAQCVGALDHLLRPLPRPDVHVQPEGGRDETRGGFYVRQLLGAANIDGGPLFHLLTGNLSFQVEHHLYPDMPSNRYSEVAPRTRDVCERYGLPYNTGPLRKQLGSVHRTILRLALPGGRPRPKPKA